MSDLDCEAKTAARREVLIELQKLEAGMFWSRFVAFAAVNTGLMILLANAINKGFIVSAGMVASCFWLYVQAVSRFYVESHKDEFWATVEDIGVQRRKVPWYFSISSTSAGVIFPFIMIVIWFFTWFAFVHA